MSGQRRGMQPGDEPPGPFAEFLQVLSIPAAMAMVVALIVASAYGVYVCHQYLGHAADRGAPIYGFAAMCTFLSLWLVIGSVFSFLNVGQTKKIDVITGFYSIETTAEYFRQFWTGRDGIRQLLASYDTAQGAAKETVGATLSQKLKELFAEDFGSKVFIVPVILMLAAGGIVLFLGYTGGIGLAVARSSGIDSPVQPFGLKLDLVSIAAIFGAYTWIASDVIVRSRQWTLHPSDLGWYALRFIVAIPLGQALAMMVGTADVTATTGGAGHEVTGAAAQQGMGAFVAFVASMFSLDAITNMLSTVASRVGLPKQSSEAEREDLVVKMSGVDEAKSRALGVEGVSTIAQLTTVDPIRLSIRTGLPFEYILNLIDAALLWTFVGAKLKSMSQLGLRGASDVLALDAVWRVDTAVKSAAFWQCDTDLAQKRTTQAEAQTALDVAQARPGADPATIAAMTQTVAAAGAAIATADAARLVALGDLLGRLGANGPQPDPADNRQAMLAALVTNPDKGGPGLTAIGFETVAARLRANTYAVFIRKLLES